MKLLGSVADMERRGRADLARKQSWNDVESLSHVHEGYPTVLVEDLQAAVLRVRAFPEGIERDVALPIYQEALERAQAAVRKVEAHRSQAAMLKAKAARIDAEIDALHRRTAERAELLGARKRQTLQLADDAIDRAVKTKAMKVAVIDGRFKR